MPEYIEREALLKILQEELEKESPWLTKDHNAGNSKTKLVCSYHCMREWDKKNLPSKSRYIK